MRRAQTAISLTLAALLLIGTYMIFQRGKAVTGKDGLLTTDPSFACNPRGQIMTAKRAGRKETYK